MERGKVDVVVGKPRGTEPRTDKGEAERKVEDRLPRGVLRGSKYYSNRGETQREEMSCFNSCRLGHTSVRETVSCKVANGEDCESLGNVTISISLERRIHIFEVPVVLGMPHFMTLGTNFWKGMSIVLNLRVRHFDTEEPGSLAVVGAICPFDELSPDQQQELSQLIQQSFEGMSQGLGCTSVVQHKNKANSDPIKQR